jgi:thiamine biosynthesis lipoprotein
MKVRHASRSRIRALFRAAFLAGLLCQHGPGLGSEPGPAAPPARFEVAETHMGSEFKIVLYTADSTIARSASRAALARIGELDAILSDYRPDSELMRLCEAAGGPPVAVGADLFDVLERSRAMYDRSDGAFDVTVGPAVRLWRRARRDRKMPDAGLLARARELIGSGRMTLDPANRTVRLPMRGMKLDLGGIAKGYACDHALAVLARAGIRQALVSGAGDIRAGDPPPGLAGWTVGIGPLEDPEAPPRRFLSLKNAAVSTSGDAERFVEIDGRRYSHIVDPRTGLGVIDRSSVTVVAPDGATADSLATAVYVLGPGRGLALVEDTEGAAALIVRSAAGGTETFASRRLAGWLDESGGASRGVSTAPN